MTSCLANSNNIGSSKNLLILTSSLRPYDQNKMKIINNLAGLALTYFPPSGFHHKLSGQMCSWLRLQWSNYDTFVQRISRNNLKRTNGALYEHNRNCCVAGSPYLPMMKYGQAKGLSLSMSSQIRLKPERVNSRYESFDDVHRRSGDGSVLSHMTSSSCQDCIDG